MTRDVDCNGPTKHSIPTVAPASHACDSRSTVRTEGGVWSHVSASTVTYDTRGEEQEHMDHGDSGHLSLGEVSREDVLCGQSHGRDDGHADSMARGKLQHRQLKYEGLAQPQHDTAQPIRYSTEWRPSTTARHGAYPHHTHLARNSSVGCHGGSGGSRERIRGRLL